MCLMTVWRAEKPNCETTSTRPHPRPLTWVGRCASPALPGPIPLPRIPVSGPGLLLFSTRRVLLVLTRCYASIFRLRFSSLSLSRGKVTLMRHPCIKEPHGNEELCPGKGMSLLRKPSISTLLVFTPLSVGTQDLISGLQSLGSRDDSAVRPCAPRHPPRLTRFRAA